MYSTLDNTPLEIDLVALANTTGWSMEGNVAVHDSCNAGTMYLLTFPIVVGSSYSFSYQVESISGGNIQPSIGTALGVARTVAGFYTETLVATGTTPRFSFYSNANCRVTLMDIKVVVVNILTKQKNSIVYSEITNKWVTYLSTSADAGVSLYNRLYTFKLGRMYVHKSNTDSRLNIYGTDYQSVLKFTENQNPTQVKTFQSINYQANQLLITTTDGITTSLGQVSELVAADFLQDSMTDGITSIDVYSLEGVYQSSFRRDKNIDLNEGDTLKGNYITIELINPTGGGILKLFTVCVNSVVSRQGIR